MAISPIMAYTSSIDMAAKTQAQTPEKVREVKPQKVDEIARATDSASADPKRFDTFEKSGENSASKVAGIYSVGKDENGNPKILFEKPEDKSAGEPSKPEDAPKEGRLKSEDDKKITDTKTTVNTDKVDAEIKKLKKEKQEIQRQLQSEENADKREKLEQRLQNIATELQSKDNDAYRKQHATYTMG